MKKENIEKFFKNPKIHIIKANKKEIKEGWLILDKNWQIKDGILYAPFLSHDVEEERKAIRLIDRRPELGGGEVYRDDKKAYFRALERLPEASNSPFCRGKGAFLNISLGETDYFKFLSQIRGKKTILEIGADSGWSARKLAKAGHNVIALDISPHLIFRNEWLKEGIFYEAICADMNNMPFRENCFDIVFSSASIHHSRNIQKLARDIYHILKPDGQFIFLREPMAGALVNKHQFGQKQKSLGVSENLYTIDEWRDAFKKAGFQNIKTDISHLDYPKYLASKKEKLIYLLKIIKRHILIIPELRNQTISDYNLTGQKPKD